MDSLNFLNMNINPWTILGVLGVVICVWIVCMFQAYKKRAFFICLFRLAWLVPIIICIFAKDKVIRTKTDFIKQDISVLVDDSSSMSKYKSSYEQSLSKLKTECEAKGCNLNIDYLSNLHPYTKLGYTPLKEVLSSWLSQRYGPWVLYTDGADSFSSVGWSLRYTGNDQSKGYVVGYESEPENKWIDFLEAPSMSFENSDISLFLRIKRNTDKKEIVQIQVLLDDKIISSQNVDFAKSKTQLDVDMKIDSLKKGNYSLKVRVVPSEHETYVWDNEAYVNVNVSSNTLGVLHIQGSPNWDGRFIRRYLKSDPKFDLISFFILRDFFDNLEAQDRESSLIPFPVDRLFVDEINHFKVIILQNFALYKFLQSEKYQTNIVNFVKNGGGLLFIGGKNSLSDMDIFHKDFSSILPFTVDYKRSALSDISDNSFKYGWFVDDDQTSINTQGPYYTSDIHFNMELVNLNSSSRNLYDVYSDWSRYDRILKSTDFSGLHRMDTTKLKPEATALINASVTNIANSAKIPIVVGSHPGRGRALWIFTDSLWKLAFNKESRNVYNDILSSSLRWLMYQDDKVYLDIDSFTLDRKLGSSKIDFSLELEGSLAKQVQINPNWKITVCGKKVDSVFEQNQSASVILTGSVEDVQSGIKSCEVEIQGTGSAFGHVLVKKTTNLPTQFTDKENQIKNGSSYILGRIVSETSASYSINGKPQNSSLDLYSWLEQKNQTLNFDSRVQKDPFWFFSTWLIYLLLIFIPLEIIVRNKLL